MKGGFNAEFVTEEVKAVKSPFPADEETIMHQFDRLCQKSLKGEAVNYYRYMDNRRKREITLSELSEEEFEKFATIDEYFSSINILVY